MFENHSSSIWILAILFIILNCNSCLEDKCEASCGCGHSHNQGCGCGNKQGIFGFSPIILIVIFFCFFNNNNNNGLFC